MQIIHKQQPANGRQNARLVALHALVVLAVCLSGFNLYLIAWIWSALANSALNFSRSSLTSVRIGQSTSIVSAASGQVLVAQSVINGGIKDEASKNVPLQIRASLVELPKMQINALARSISIAAPLFAHFTNTKQVAFECSSSNNSTYQSSYIDHNNKRQQPQCKVHAQNIKFVKRIDFDRRSLQTSCVSASTVPKLEEKVDVAQRDNSSNNLELHSALERLQMGAERQFEAKAGKQLKLKARNEIKLKSRQSFVSVRASEIRVDALIVSRRQHNAQQHEQHRQHQPKQPNDVSAFKLCACGEQPTTQLDSLESSLGGSSFVAASRVYKVDANPIREQEEHEQGRRQKRRKRASLIVGRVFAARPALDCSALGAFACA